MSCCLQVMKPLELFEDGAELRLEKLVNPVILYRDFVQCLFFINQLLAAVHT